MIFNFDDICKSDIMDLYLEKTIPEIEKHFNARIRRKSPINRLTCFKEIREILFQDLIDQLGSIQNYPYGVDPKESWFKVTNSYIVRINNNFKKYTRKPIDDTTNFSAIIKQATREKKINTII